MDTVEIIIHIIVIIWLIGSLILDWFGFINQNKHKGGTIILGLISVFLIGGYVWWKWVARRSNTFLELYNPNNDWTALVLTILILTTTIPITFLLGKEKKDKDKDTTSGITPSEREERTKNTWNIIVMFISILLIILMLYIIIKFDELFLRIFAGTFILVIIGSAILYFVLVGGKKIEKTEEDPKLDVEYPGPTFRQKSLKDLKKLLKNLGDFKMDNECKIYDQTNCSYLYNQYVASSGDETILNELLDKLSSMKKKDGETDKTSLINQAIFIIYQILQCRIELDYKETVYRFGTWEWWYQNIYMGKFMEKFAPFSPGTDPMQRYIYFIALLVCIVFIVLNLIKYVMNMTKIFDSNIGWAGTGVGFTVVHIGLIIWLIISNLSAAQEPEQVDKPVSKEYQKYEQDYDPDTTLSKEKTGLGSLFGYLGTIVGLTALSYMGGDSPLGKLSKINAIAIVMAMVISFNAYYMFLIPQLVIIGLILQKYILLTSLTDNLLATIVKGIVLIAVLFASFYETTYNTKNIEKEGEVKENAKKVTGVRAAYNKPIWYIFGILMALLLQNGVESFTGETDVYENNWSLILMPMARYMMNIISKTSIPYDAVSISNGL